MADSNPPEEPNPDDPEFGLSMFGDLAKLFGGASGGPWETARQLAATTATEGKPEDNVDPVDRVALEQLVRIAELRVNNLTGRLTGGSGPVTVDVTNRTGWASRTITDYQQFLQGLSDALSRPPEGAEAQSDDPMAAMFGSMFTMLGPMMLGLTAGSMVGSLARHSQGGYSLPIPRPVGSPLLVSIPPIDELAEDWSLDRNDVRLWVCLHEVASLAVLGVPHIHDELTTMLDRYVKSFRLDPTVIQDSFGNIDLSDPSSLMGLQDQLGNPDLMLQALKSPEQDALQPALAALVAVVVGVVDFIVEQVGSELIHTHGQITEAIHRQRVTATEADRFVERLLGLDLDQTQYDRGAAFVAGVRERAGNDGLFRLFKSTKELPTTAEADAPGLWLARIDLPDPE